MSETPFNPPRLVGDEDTCPVCKAARESRVPSGFGQSHDVCSKCGYEFEEDTCRS